MNTRKLPLAVATALLVLPLAAHAAAPQAHAIAGKGEVAFDTSIDAPGLQLRVTGPGGFLREALYVQGEPLSLPISGAQGWPDGQYRFELWPVEGVARRSGNAPMEAGPVATPSASGSFRVVDGAVVAPAASTGPGDQDGGSFAKDQVIADDLVVQGSGCFGFDCVNGENFGFDTLKLKENNLRIKFEDTSVDSYPSNDWQLLVNDSASGGQNKFSIEDVTGARVPFTVEAGASTNSIYIDSTGRVGFRTSTPVLDLHVSTSNTPAMRLEQTSAGGFTAQTWDIAGNEANFFVRDVTSGSRLPFRIRPGAPTSSVDINAAGDVGVGTGSPTAALDIARSNMDVELRLSNTATSGVMTDWTIKNNDATGRLTFSDDPAETRVPFKFAPGAVDNLLRVGVLGTDVVDINGDLVVTGTITPDYVFDKAFALPSIEEHAAAMWENRHLPKVAPAQANAEGKGLINVGARAQGMLEELEYAHIYIEQLNAALADLRKQTAARDAEVALLRAELAEIKAALR